MKGPVLAVLAPWRGLGYGALLSLALSGCAGQPDCKASASCHSSDETRGDADSGIALRDGSDAATTPRKKGKKRTAGDDPDAAIEKDDPDDVVILSPRAGKRDASTDPDDGPDGDDKSGDDDTGDDDTGDDDGDDSDDSDDSDDETGALERDAGPIVAMEPLPLCAEAGDAGACVTCYVDGDCADERYACRNEHGQAALAGDDALLNACECALMPAQLAEDPENCGACGHVCRLDHAESACVDGSCVVLACEERFGDCNTDAEDGCETGELDLPPAPTPLLPVAGHYTGSLHAPAERMTLRPTLAWSSITTSCGQTAYEFQVDDSCLAGELSSCAFSSPEWSGSTTETSVTPEADLPVSTAPPVGALYAWRVRACDASLHCSAWRTSYLHVGRLPEDINGDGYGDLIHAQVLSGYGMYLWTYQGGPSVPADSVVTPTRIGDEAAVVQANYAGDLDADGYGDITVGFQDDERDNAARLVFGDKSWSNLHVLAGTIASYQYFAVASLGAVPGIGDDNADGFADFVQFDDGRGGRSGRVFYGPSGTVGRIVRWDSRPIGDVNADGIGDLAAVSAGSLLAVDYGNSENGVDLELPLPAAAGACNGSIAAASPTSPELPLGLLLGCEGGILNYTGAGPLSASPDAPPAEFQLYSIPGNLTAHGVSDFDSDGRPEAFLGGSAHGLYDPGYRLMDSGFVQLMDTDFVQLMGGLVVPLLVDLSGDAILDVVLTTESYPSGKHLLMGGSVDAELHELASAWYWMQLGVVTLP